MGFITLLFIQVEGAGLVSTSKSTSVSYSPSDCPLCTPEVVVQKEQI